MEVWSGKFPKIRSNKAQLKYLCQYMAAHPDFAAGEYRGPQAARKMAEEWALLKLALDKLGQSKTVDQWKICWRDQKRKARIEGGAHNRAVTATGSSGVIPELSENTVSIEPEMAVSIGPEESQSGFDPAVDEKADREQEQYQIRVRPFRRRVRRATSPDRSLMTDNSGSSSEPTCAPLESLPTPPLPSLLIQPHYPKRKKDSLNDPYENMKSPKNKKESMDEFEIYGQYVASELRNVQDEEALLQAKYDINNILLKARMSKFNNNHSGRYHGYRDGRRGYRDGCHSAPSTQPYIVAAPSQTPEPQVHNAVSNDLSVIKEEISDSDSE